MLERGVQLLLLKGNISKHNKVCCIIKTVKRELKWKDTTILWVHDDDNDDDDVKKGFVNVLL